MGLLGFALRRLRGDPRPALTTWLAVLIAVTSFVVLTGTADTQRLEVTRTLDDNFRGAYDILVRPKDSTTELERATGQVRSSFLSGVYGGISREQVAAIQGIGGIEAAAPIVMVGVTFQTLVIPVDVTDLVPEGQRRTLLRFTVTNTSRDGAIRVPGPAGWLYVTRDRFRPGSFTKDQGDSTFTVTDEPYETVDGTRRFPCVGGGEVAAGEGGAARSWNAVCVSLAGGNSASVSSLVKPGRAAIPLEVAYPLLVAAIDPVQEAKLVGLDSAVVAGRYLTAEDGWLPGTSGGTDPAAGRVDQAPALLSTSQVADYASTISVEALPASAAEDYIRTPLLGPKLPVVKAAAGVPVDPIAVEASDVYARYLGQNPPGELTSDATRDQSWVPVLRILRPEAPTYTGIAPLTPRVVENPRSAFGDQPYLPATIDDTGFRQLTSANVTGSGNWQNIALQIVGHYDPDRIRQGGQLGRVPLETYTAAGLRAADPATRDALGDDLLRSDLNPAGYPQLPPSVLMSIDSLDVLQAGGSGPLPRDPVSAVRVRVAGVRGADPVSRERIRLAAQRIHEATGLDVDITAGSSQVAQRVELPKTAMGVPALSLDELWSVKGVAVRISQALDTKSLLLFVLILLSSALTVAVSANAAVQARRRELGTLACVGWPPGRLRREVLLELSLIGTAAGLVGAGLAAPLAAALGVNFDPLRAWWTIPIAVALTVLAGLPATRAAARTHPIAALRPAVRAPRRAGGAVASAGSLGLRQLLRRPLRLLLGGLAVAMATASATLLGSILFAFQGAAVGSFLGDAVALQVRTPDLVAVGFLALLGVVAVSTILSIGLNEDVRGFAALQAVGWRDATLAAALVTQAAAVGAVGAVVGLAVGLGVIAGLLGTVAAPTLIVGFAVAGCSVIVAATAALGPALRLRRLPVARLLAED